MITWGFIRSEMSSHNFGKDSLLVELDIVERLKS